MRISSSSSNLHAPLAKGNSAMGIEPPLSRAVFPSLSQVDEAFAWDGLIVPSFAFRQANRTGPCFTSRLGIVAGCVALPQSRLGIAHETVPGLW